MAPNTPHSAKATKKHSLIRSSHNKATGKYVRQRARTEARKARKLAGDTCKLRRLARRRAARKALLMAA